MKNFIMLSLITIILGGKSTFASVDDVVGNDNFYVKITESEDQTAVSFALCDKKSPQICQQIGKKKFYYKEEILAQRNYEKWHILYAVIADVGVIAASAVGGGYVVGNIAFLITGSAPAGAAYALLGILGGGVTGVILDFTINTLNPYDQYKQLQTIESDVLNDKDVKIKTSTKTFARRLETVLNNLE